jgi:hypothetical protein
MLRDDSASVLFQDHTRYGDALANCPCFDATDESAQNRGFPIGDRRVAVQHNGAQRCMIVQFGVPEVKS